MGRAKGGSRGRIPPRERSSAHKARPARCSEALEQGDLGEVAFVHKAMSLGFTVAKPYGHNHRYDFIVDGGKNLWRVQVKTCTHLRDDLYIANVAHSLNGAKASYTRSDCDFVVFYVMPEDTWYVLPVREVLGRTTLHFRKANTLHRRDPFAHDLEAWHLLRDSDGLTFG